ncbi:MAG TPA: class I SAM-dependent methyltransferase, partial [Pirellulales bacterium]
MLGKPVLSGRKKSAAGKKKRKQKVLQKLVENDLISRVSYEQYRDKVREVYGGPQGAMLATCSMLSLHIPLGERLFRERKFDLHGLGRVLDVGSGAGQIARHVLKYADPTASVTCIDLSVEMLRRARHRLKSTRP